MRGLPNASGGDRRAVKDMERGEREARGGSGRARR